MEDRLDFSPYVEANERLENFQIDAGFQYTMYRNYVAAPTEHQNVSRLSPFIRHRTITETDVLSSVVQHHGPQKAEKFIEEIFWRAYWKGWLEQRPEVWTMYCADLARLKNDLLAASGLRQKWADACHGYTGIECFDSWVNEILETGYLHNHARMWFASIWVYTLGLPWQLGADFFMRHLLDGDPASNTLSWRWVCGLQTEGKTYLATQENIERFTNNRFSPTGLATTAPPVEGYIPRNRQAIRPVAKADPLKRSALLLHDEDMEIGAVIQSCEKFDLCLQMTAPFSEPAFLPSNAVTEFKTQLRDARNKRFAETCADPITVKTVKDLIDQLRANNIEQVVTPYAPVGPITYSLMTLKEQLLPMGINLVEVRNPYDDLIWPHATHGFFRLRKHIPYFLEQLGIG